MSTKREMMMGDLPGFRFHPTDEELVSFYLRKRVQQQQQQAEEEAKRPLTINCALHYLIPDLDIYKHDPWDLPRYSHLGEGHSGYYFFSPRDRKYRNSTRPNRVTVSGFWKATGTDRLVHLGGDATKECVGFKKSLVFYHGRASKGSKTNWMMHEFRLPVEASCSHKDTCWAVCKIFKKKSSNVTSPISMKHAHLTIEMPRVGGMTFIKSAPDISSEKNPYGEDSKSDNTSVTSLAPASHTAIHGMHAPSTYIPDNREGTLNPVKPVPQPLTITKDRAPNYWTDEVLRYWFSPAMPKPFNTPRLIGRASILEDISTAVMEQQRMQECMQMQLASDYLGHSFCSSQGSLPFSLWD